MVDLASPPLSAAALAPFPGFSFDPNQIRVGTASIAAAANASIPGPAAGYVRFFDVVLYQADVAASVMAAVVTTLQPAGTVMNPTQTGAGSTQWTTPPPLVNGESFRVANGGANAMSISYWYWDEPLGGRVAFRDTITGAAYKVLIPAAPAGKIGRFVIQRRWNGFSSIAPNGALNLFNADTTAHTLQLFRGAGTALLGRGTSAGAGAVMTTTGGFFAYVDSTQDLTGRLDQAVVTTPVVIQGLYEYVAAPV